VKGNQPFLPVTYLEAKQRLGAVGTLEIWPQITYDELTTNVRQKNDKQYAELVSNVRTGMLTDDQHKLLSTRLIVSDRRPTVDEVCHHYEQLQTKGEQPMILLPRSAACAEVNNAMLHKIGTKVIKLTAQDTLDTIVHKSQQSKVRKAYDVVADDVTRTAGLEKSLNVCIGAKVMLKRNKSVESGLVNGAVGSVVGFSEKDSEIQQILVKFDWIDAPVPVQRESCTFEVLKCVFYTRKQFPLILAFALTIHKSQGLSLPCAIIDVGSTCFGTGMVYVALSRVTTLQGLHLIALDTSKIVCDKKAVSEYNRLRKKYTPHLNKIQTAEDPSAENSDNHHHTEHLQSSQNTDEFGVGALQHSAVERSDNTPVLNVDHAELHDSPNTTTNVISEPAIRIFDFCDIRSLDQEFQMATCSRLNLHLCPIEQSVMSPTQATVANRLAHYIYTTTNIRTNINIQDISGDGNCLFRALSNAVCRSQMYHDLLRLYVVNHMTDPEITGKLKLLFGSGQSPGTAHVDHILSMQEPGEWGTEEEIVTAAHLLQCSIVCFSQYNTNDQYCLQHFPPHFINFTHCTKSCKHKTIYLINSGLHYESAVVTYAETEQSEE